MSVVGSGNLHRLGLRSNLAKHGPLGRQHLDEAVASGIEDIELYVACFAGLDAVSVAGAVEIRLAQSANGDAGLGEIADRQR